MTQESPLHVLTKYLEDAIAAESNFESQLRAMSQEGDNEQAKQLFQQHAEQTKSQYDRLVARLQKLGSTPSTTKSVLAHLFGFAPQAGKIGHQAPERATQNLMIAFAVENSEVAMYESLATVAAAANDPETEQLARTIQQEERATAEKVFALLAPSARHAYDALTSAAA